jgi:formamidopyrimidine-DNA glycosylase
MPELPEVETVVRDLRPRITGATIVDATTLWARTLRGITPEQFADGVAGRRIEAVGRRAKQIVVDLSGGAFLTIHLKMTGQLFVVPQGGLEDPYVRLVLFLEDGREIRFRDIRKFGKIGLYVADDADPFAKIGPEPLSDAFTIGAFRRRLRSRTGRLKPLLLDQTFIAGIGNIYADEALWAARLHYDRPTDRLTPGQVAALLAELRLVLERALADGGTSFDAQYVNVNGASGYFSQRLNAYGQQGKPCARCGTPIASRQLGDAARMAYWCPTCQRGEEPPAT